MEKQPELPKSPEENLAAKKTKLKKAVNLMLDWQKSSKIESSLFPHLNDLTDDEVEYCLKLIRNLDNKTQLRGPLAESANQALTGDEVILKEMEGKIGLERAEELKNLIE